MIANRANTHATFMLPWRFVAAVALLATGMRAHAGEFTAVEHQRQTIYHSPQKPGFTSWVGAWMMPGGSLMVSFTQATGPVQGRPKAPRTCRTS